jgi:hypothetical protein
MTESDLPKVCINTNAFIFNSGCIRAKKNKHTKKKKYINTGKHKCCVFELYKCNFTSSSVGVSTSIDDAWNVLLSNLLNMIDGYFLISLTNCDSNCKKIHYIYSKLRKYKINTEKDKINLYFTYNISPMENNQISMNGECLQFNTDVFYNLKNKKYCNIQFWYDKDYTFTPIKIPNV